MPNPFVNKKKIRGWKRKVKQIEQWKQRCMVLDIDTLNRNNRDYVKLWIDPFYRLTRRNPPLWYSRLLLAAMIEVYESWHLKMKAFDEPFYLKIWFYHPNFIDSQVVVAFRDCLNYYDAAFDKSDMAKRFPAQLYGNHSRLEKFKWELAIDAYKYWLSELDEDVRLGFSSPKRKESIQRRAYKSETLQLNYGEDTLYKIRAGDVWIGQWKE